MATDATLLSQYADTRDAKAFRLLVERHAGMVYGAALRVTGNVHDAEDVTQECFMQLARHARSAARATAGWLHRTATNRALDAVRRRATRRRYETTAPPRPADAGEPTWEEIAPHVDAALDALPAELRAPLVAHFLEGRSQTEIAAELGVNQSTVSRRVERGVERLRDALTRAGVVAPAAVLVGALGKNGVATAPHGVVSALGKLALAGVAAKRGTAAVARAVAVAVGMAAAVGVVALFLLTGNARQQPAAALPPPKPVQMPRETEMLDEPKAAVPERVLLEGVPPMRYGQDGFNPFALSLKSCLAYLGDDVGYGDILGVSGVGFRMSWNFNTWDPGNMDLGILGAEPMRRGVRAAGYRPRFLVRASWWLDEAPGDDLQLIDDDEAEAPFREAVIGSIGRGVPVLAFGVVGPPEVSLITGYDEGGDVLIGWSCFQDEHPKDQVEITGEYRKRDWIDGTQGIVVLDGRLPEAEMKAVRLGALEWAYAMLTHPKTAAHLHGPAAYEGWADGMRDDESFPAEDEDTIQSRRYTVWDGLIMLAERGHAADFLEAEADRLPDAAEHLFNAAAALREDGDCGGRITDVLGGPWLPSEGLTDPAKRREVADLILQARDKNAEAAAHLARALEALP